ncbi:MAG: PAS domain S-box protein, partial [Limisphaerales bacterium]
MSTLTEGKAIADVLDGSWHFQQFAEKVAQVFWVVDTLTGDVVYLSPAYERVLGKDGTSLLEAPDSWIEAIHADDRARVARAFESGPSSEREETYRILRPNGGMGWIRHRAFPICDGDGTVCRVLNIAEDFTERKRHEQQWEVLSWVGSSLNVAETAIQAADIILDAAQELFSWECATVDLYDADTDIVTSVAAMDTIDGKLVRCAVSPDPSPSPLARSVLLGGARLVLRKADEGTNNTTNMFGDKSRPSKSMMLAPIRMGGRTVGVLSVQSYRVNDYTKADLDLLQVFADHVAAALNRIKAEEKRREAEERLAEQAALLELTPDAVMVRSLDDRIIYWNKGAERLFGWTKQEVLGKGSVEMYKDRHKFQETVTAVLEQGEWSGELVKLTKSGGEVTVQSRSTLILGPDHRPKAILIINSDVTDQKKLEAHMLRAQRL